MRWDIRRWARDALAIRDALIIHPGDYVAIITEQPLRDHTAHEMRRMFSDTWPDVRVAIISGLDAQVVVLSRDDERLPGPPWSHHGTGPAADLPPSGSASSHRPLAGP